MEKGYVTKSELMRIYGYTQFIVSKVRFAEIMGVAPSMVTKWQKSQFPVLPDGRIDFHAGVRFLAFKPEGRSDGRVRERALLMLEARKSATLEQLVNNKDKMTLEQFRIGYEFIMSYGEKFPEDMPETVSSRGRRR